jgi:predicted enzyme related to lactoylglutathione lyase
VDSAYAATERAKNAGATVLLGPMEVPGGDRIAVMLDPQGAAFAVHSKPAQ